jgi:hypothetical protein
LQKIKAGNIRSIASFPVSPAREVLPDQFNSRTKPNQIMKKKLLVAVTPLAMRLMIVQILFIVSVSPSYGTDAGDRML